MKNLRLLSVTIAAFLLTVTTAQATPISYTLAMPFQSVAPGGTVTFDATITNNTSHVIYLNGDSSSLDGSLDPSDLSDADYDANFPLSLTGGQSVTDALFTVTIPLGTSTGIYAGSFEITGGRNNTDQFNLGAANFDVSVTGSAVPEPPSLMLLLSGLAGLSGVLRRRTRLSNIRPLGSV